MTINEESFDTIVAGAMPAWYAALSDAANEPHLGDAEMLCNMGTMDTWRKIFYGDVGIGLPTRVGETSLPRFDAVRPGYFHQVFANEYGLGTSISMRAQATAIGKEMFGKTTKAIVQSFRRLQDIHAVNMVIRAFTDYNGADGVPIFSNAHPIIRGTRTWSNVPSGTLTLSYAGLTQARLAMRRQLGFNGARLPFQQMGNLYVTPTDEVAAAELFQSTTKIRIAGDTVTPVEKSFWATNAPTVNVVTGLDLQAYPNMWFFSNGKPIECLKKGTSNAEEKKILQRAVYWAMWSSWGMMIADGRGKWGSTGL